MFCKKFIGLCGGLTVTVSAVLFKSVSDNGVQKPMVSNRTANSNKISEEQQRLNTLESAINKSMLILCKLQEDSGCPGLSITVAVNGETVWKEGLGLSDLENGVRFSPDTVMKIASISKPITMLLVAKACETGDLDLDADIKQYVPYWPAKYWAGEMVTVTTRQLASHLAGIRDYKPKIKVAIKTPSSDNQEDFDYEEYYITKKYKSIQESLDIFKDDPLISKPGSEFHYTTHGFTVLSAVLEGATGNTFKVQLENLFKELGLENTYIEEAEKIRYNLARLYIKENDRIKNAPFTESSFKIAGAGLLSTTNDIVRFGNILLYSYQQQTSSDLPGFLKQSTVSMLWTPVANTAVSWDARGRYGMGWQLISPENGMRYVGHTGGTVGASSALIILLTANDHSKTVSPHGVVVVAILCNLQGVSLGRIAVQIGDNFLNACCPDRNKTV